MRKLKDEELGMKSGALSFAVFSLLEPLLSFVCVALANSGWRREWWQFEGIDQCWRQLIILLQDVAKESGFTLPAQTHDGRVQYNPEGLLLLLRGRAASCPRVEARPFALRLEEAFVPRHRHPSGKGFAHHGCIDEALVNHFGT